MQDDCNLVVYDMSSYPGTPTWASGTNGRGSTCFAQLSSTGVVSVTSGASQVYAGKAGASGTYILVMQNDGNLVVYPTALWSSNTNLNDIIITNPCSSGYCQNGGTCQGSTGVAVCTCANGFSGSTCATCVASNIIFNGQCIANPCTAGLCQNSGVCSSSTGVAVCTCVNGFSGTTCATCVSTNIVFGGKCIANPCTLNLCNTGSCSSSTGVAVCTCVNGFSGAFCATCVSTNIIVSGRCIVNPCNAAPCANGGSCVGTSGNAVCTCVTNHAGPTCTSCNSGFTVNGATCTCNAGSFINGAVCSAYGGSYAQSCSGCSVSGTTLSCQKCGETNGQAIPASLNLASCTNGYTSIDNDNGFLQCFASSVHGGSL